MKNLLKNLINKLLLFILIFSAIFSGVYAQSNLTDSLGISSNDRILTISGNNKNNNFSTARGKLNTANADCFLITANFSSSNFSSLGTNQTRSVYKFYLKNKLIYDIGVVNIGNNEKRWYIFRPTKISDFGKNITLKYQLYDDLGVDGTFTFILGHYFTAISVDDGATNFKLAPVFFGMDSNLGTLNSHIGEFTGETSNGYVRKIFFRRASKVWKMDGDAKIATLHNLLKNNINNIQNKTVKTKNKTLAIVTSELNTFERIKLYPNPSNGIFNIDFVLNENSTLVFKIMNLNGRIVYEEKEKLFNKGNNKFTFKNKLSSGVYVLQISSSKLTKSLKILIE